jgi:hypothetical protein
MSHAPTNLRQRPEDPPVGFQILLMVPVPDDHVGYAGMDTVAHRFGLPAARVGCGERSEPHRWPS